jgi:hypothetical protein
MPGADRYSGRMRKLSQNKKSKAAPSVLAPGQLGQVSDGTSGDDTANNPLNPR